MNRVGRRNPIGRVVVGANAHQVLIRVGVAINGRTADIDRRFVIIAFLAVPLLLVLIVRHRNGRWTPVQVLLEVTLPAFATTCFVGQVIALFVPYVLEPLLL